MTSDNLATKTKVTDTQLQWVSEWVSEWMNEWMNEWMHEWMNEWITIGLQYSNNFWSAIHGAEGGTMGTFDTCAHQRLTRMSSLRRCKFMPTGKAKLLWMTSHCGPAVVRSVTKTPFHVYSSLDQSQCMIHRECFVAHATQGRHFRESLSNASFDNETWRWHPEMTLLLSREAEIVHKGASVHISVCRYYVVQKCQPSLYSIDLIPVRQHTNC